MCTQYGNLVNEDDEKEQDREKETRRLEKGGKITRTIVTGLLRGPTCPTLYKARQSHPTKVLQGNTRRSEVGIYNLVSWHILSIQFHTMSLNKLTHLEE